MLAVSYFGFMLEIITKEDFKLLATTNFLQISSGIGLAGLLVSPFFFPNIIYGLPRYPQMPQDSISVIPGVKNKPAGIRPYSPSFETEYLDFICQKTDSYMMEFQPYLQRDCNLALFAKLTQIPVHHLAYYFREHKKQSFNDFRNGYRVDHAKNLMKEGKSRDLTLEAIGILSGFSSRKTFLNDFKKVEKISPNTYLQRLKNKGDF
jgi:AraC-like DNA-binding protein